MPKRANRPVNRAIALVLQASRPAERPEETVGLEALFGKRARNGPYTGPH